MGLEGLPKLGIDVVLFGVSLIGFIGWLSRLESKGATNERDLDRLEKRVAHQEKRHDDLENRVMDKLSRIEQIVAKIEGKLLP